MGSLQMPNLLDEAVGGHCGGRMVLVEDCVETSGAFVIHHLLKRSLSSQSSDIVVFLSFAQIFTHYDRILRKMGCNLNVYRDKKRFQFIDMSSLGCLGENLQRKDLDTEYLFMELYSEVQGAVESFAVGSHAIVIIDDISLMEIDVNDSPSLVLDFIKYCCSLTPQFGCSLVSLIHGDVYSSMDRPSLVVQLEYLADVVIKVEPLATGLATDIHGQLTVSKKGLGLEDGFNESRNRMHNMHFRIKDSSIEYFYPGTKS